MWLELHDKEGRSIFVNMALATEFRKWKPEDTFTQIYMGSSGEKGQAVLVIEEPNDIMNMISEE